MNGRCKPGTTHIGQAFLRVFGPTACFPPPTQGRLQPKGGVGGFPSPRCRPGKHLPAPGWGPGGSPRAVSVAAPWGWPTAAGVGCGGAGWHWDGRTAERGNRWKLDGGWREKRDGKRPPVLSGGLFPPSRLRGLASSFISNMMGGLSPLVSPFHCFFAHGRWGGGLPW